MKKIALTFGASGDREKQEACRRAMREVGFETVDNPTSLDQCAGLCLTGGTDIDPAIYKAAKDPRTDIPDLERDRMEQALLREALAKSLPLLAICRGMQLLNASLGGSLKQHIDDHKNPDAPDAHTIEIEPKSRLAAILGTAPYSVNSFHHQAIDRVAESLSVVARSTNDGIIEAVEYRVKPFVVGVQWHPERRPGTPDARIFQAFFNAANQGR